MKKVIVFTIVLFIISNSFAQQTVASQKTAKKTISPKKNAIAGMITDMHNFPIKGTKAFIYQSDSSIIASGYTDEQGHYETNSIFPGTYNVKIVYPSQKTTMITGVIVKSGITFVNIKAEIPVADTSIPYSDIAVKALKKKKGNH